MPTRPEILAFCLGDELVARTDDQIDGRHRLRPIGESGDGLRAAHAEDPVHAGDVKAHQHGGVDPVVALGRRRTRGNVTDARDLGGNDRMQRSRRQRVTTGGHVRPHRRDRDQPVPQGDPRESLAAKGQEAVELPRGERPQLLGRELQAFDGPGLDSVVGILERLARHFQSIELGAVEPLRQAQDGSVAARTDLGDELGDKIGHLHIVDTGLRDFLEHLHVSYSPMRSSDGWCGARGRPVSPRPHRRSPADHPGRARRTRSPQPRPGGSP